MRATQALLILAELLDVPLETAYRIDRSLAEAGLRARGKGRSIPDVTREELLSFMLACMVAEKITKAADDVERWQAATGLVNPAPDKSPDPVWGVEWHETLYGKHYAVLEPLLAPLRDATGQITLINYLLAICTLVEAGMISPDCVRLEIVPSEDRAFVHHAEPDGDPLTSDMFEVPVEGARHQPRNSETKITRSVSVGGAALQEIIQRTR